MASKRILFLAEGATMAHFARPLSLACTLDPNRYDIHFFAPARYARYLEGQPFHTGVLDSMPGERFLAHIATGKPLFPADVLRRYVEEDRGLFNRLRPDLVIGDMRLSLPISGRLENVPHAVMINAYWSPYANRQGILPALPVTRVIPPRLLGPLYRLTERTAFAVHVAPSNQVRKQFGIPPLPPDIRVMYTEGTYVLYPDIPEFVPTPGAPAEHHYVGICPWAPVSPLPEWWERMRADPKPKVFVSLGSSGPLEALPAVLRACESLGAGVVLATSGRPTAPVPSTAYIGGLLPMVETAQESRVVVSHGGSGGLYPAIAAGTPVLAIPSNADQQQSTAVMAENGAGIGVRVEEASGKNVRRALERLLFEPQFRDAAQHWAAIYARYDSGVLFRRFISETLDASSADANAGTSSPPVNS